MRIHEITTPVNEGVLDWAAAKGAALIAGKKPVVDPLTGKFKLNPGQQKWQDYQGQQQRNEYTKRAVTSFLTYVNNQTGDTAPDAATFGNLLEKWAEKYLPPTGWNWPSSYDTAQRNEINNAFNQAKQEYARTPSTNALAPAASRLVTVWLEQTRKQQEYDVEQGKEQPWASSHGGTKENLFNEVVSVWPDSVKIPDILGGINSNRSIGPTLNPALDNYLKGMGYRLSTGLSSPVSVSASTSQEITNKLTTDNINARAIGNYLQSRSNNTQSASTGNEVVDAFIKIMGFTLS